MTVYAVSPSPCLRFVERDGKRILQQAWVKRYWLSGILGPPTEHEWRDVPVVDEDAPELPWGETGYV